MNFFFDTNFYRYLVKDIQLGLINFDELKIAEKEKNYNVLFSNIVAAELINHLDENDFEQRECLNALKCLCNHTTKKIIDKNERFDIVPTFQHILTRYFFDKQSKTDLFNKSIFLFSKKVSFNNLNVTEIKNFIKEIVVFKKEERENLINVLELDLIKTWSSEGESDWNILNQNNKKIRIAKKYFNEKLSENYFHDLIAISFYNLAKINESLITEKTKDVILKDYENSIDFIITHVISKVGKSKSLKNYFSKKWNYFYDMQLILGLEYYNKFSSTKLITNDMDILLQVNKNNQKLGLNKEDYLKELNLWKMKNKFYNYIQTLQDQICKGLEEIDGVAKFREDIWERPEGGGGRTRVIENGQVFEKGGVNISAVHGKLPDSMQKLFNVGEADFFACGLSLVIHPKNPMVPTVHANWRYFETYPSTESGETPPSGAGGMAWFGGGQDLTPYYLFEEDAVHFHQTCKTACDKHNPEFYPKYKKQCDAYFWNAHRNEARGIGGLFFDYLKETETMKMQDWYNFVTEVGNSFLQAYLPIVEKRKELPFTEAQKTWQEIRRGRYVEFNLVHDKGTLFGLKTNGRIESILMSLPPHVQWVYDHHPEEGSEEEKLIRILTHPLDWI